MQWAINAVDFRDRDSIMTAFEYDQNPLNGWDVDGDLSTTTDTDRAVVWGVERPELLITETLAGHDRGTDDTSLDTEDNDQMRGMGSDGDYDQVARPDGWVMIELYNPQPKPVAPAVSSAELHDTTGTGLWLNRVAPDPTNPADPNSSPVWRIAIGQPNTAVHPSPIDDERKDPVLDPAQIERTIYFGEPQNGAVSGGSVKYYSSYAGNLVLEPGRYAVVGSQGVDLDGNAVSDTVVGRGYNAGSGAGVGLPRIDLGVAPLVMGDPNTVYVQDDGMKPPVASMPSYPKYENSPAGSPATTDEQIQPPLAIEIDMPRRLSISEPALGYPTVFDPLAPPDGTPWDAAANEEWFGEVNSGETVEAETTQIGAYNRVYLQRLANPTLEWNAETNPYLTVDSMPVDLWVYNSTADEDGASAEPDPIRSRERMGDATDETVGDGNFNIWRQWAGDETPGPGNGPTPDTVFHTDLKLQHTLGYLNTAWHTGEVQVDHRWWTPAEFAKTENQDALGKDVALTGRLYDEEYYIGAPLTPTPWLTWNDRPYYSKYELMLVPKSSPSELLAEYSTLNSTSQPYDMNEEGEYSRTYDPGGAGDPKSHLLNFFYHSDKDGSDQHNDLYRIFEFVDVPSRFSGLEEMLDPTSFEATDTPWTNNQTIFGWGPEANPKRQFPPPYNYLSKYREPGKVNLNTVFDDGSTWRAILGGFDNGYAGAPDWATIQQSRRGYLPGTAILDASGNPTLDLGTPTLMARPFRSFSGGYFAPTDALRHEGIESTLLRSSPAPAAAGQPLFALTSATQETDTTKNPYFRYQLMNRLSNMVTTRSNVYAVWITVGYFEVEPVDRTDAHYTSRNYTDPEFDRVFPDGYRLKGELGADTGEVERHRAFYMVDRLVPVAFERGKTHNTRKTIRLRTIIE